MIEVKKLMDSRNGLLICITEQWERSSIGALCEIVGWGQINW